jgi:hypothetical protein
VLRKSSDPIIKKAGYGVPFVGPAVGAAYDLYKTDYEQGIRKMEAENMEALLDKTGLCVQFDLEVVRIFPEDAPAQAEMMIFPGVETKLRIENYNAWVELRRDQSDLSASDKLLIESIGNRGVITERDLYIHAQALKDICNNKNIMDQHAVGTVFGPQKLICRIIKDEYGNETAELVTQNLDRQSLTISAGD